VAVNVAEVAPDGTATEEGEARNELLSESVTEAPPPGAALFKLTVQVVIRPPTKVDGLHPTDDIVTGATTVTVAVLEVRL
jgi:hypothetical protein